MMKIKVIREPKNEFKKGDLVELINNPDWILIVDTVNESTFSATTLACPVPGHVGKSHKDNVTHSYRLFKGKIELEQ